MKFRKKVQGHSEPALTSAPPWRMNGEWSANSFLLGSSCLANHGGYLSCFFFHLASSRTYKYNLQVGC
jgi:hypothetical protein